jgi:hypothetical protein
VAWYVLDLTGFNLTDPLAGVVEKMRVFPAGLFFMATLLLSVQGTLVPWANKEGARIPRRARFLIAFGASHLIASMMFFLLNAADTATGKDFATGPILPTLFALGALLLGVPFLIYLAVKKQNELAGDEEEWGTAVARTRTARFGGLARLVVLAMPVLLFLFGAAVALADALGLAS